MNTKIEYCGIPLNIRYQLDQDYPFGVIADKAELNETDISELLGESQWGDIEKAVTEKRKEDKETAAIAAYAFKKYGW